MSITGIYSPLDVAMHEVVHGFPGGSQRLAPLVGMRPGTLSNKVNPDYDGTSLFVPEAVAIQNTARNCAILYAEASLLNHSCVALGDFSALGDIALLEAYTQYHARIGETAQALHDALIDGRISKAEAQRVSQSMHEDFRAGLALLARVEALIDD